MVLAAEQRRFALEVVRRLRARGFEAYWAGGCVRDELLGRVPKDYDVATSARPAEIRELFGHRRTLAIGAAFGVITVRGPRQAGMIEVATFRQDATYSDGRHPDHVTFTSAQEDARRRDFTINGLFYDPVEQRVLDFVGGQEDLARRVIRAIGRPGERFAEDKLRMLRAVRFAAGFDFALDPDTADAIRAMAGQIAVVSPERIAMEMRRMLTEPGRTKAVRLMIEVSLAAAVLPEIVPHDDARRGQLDHALDVLERLGGMSQGGMSQFSFDENGTVPLKDAGAHENGTVPLGEDRAETDENGTVPLGTVTLGFPLALAALLHSMVDAETVCQIGLRWRLSNKEIERAVWLVEHHAALTGAPAMRWSQLQPLLVSEGIEDLLALHEAAAPEHAAEVAYCRDRLQQPRELLDPPPLVTGDDLRAHGIPPGPVYKTLLERLRAAQLDGEIQTAAEGLALAERWWRGAP